MGGLMSLSARELATRLRAERLADPEGVLKPGGRAEVLSAIDASKARGLTAFVLVSRDESLASANTIWGALGADPKRDLLLFLSGREWTARGWGLTPEQIRGALQTAEPDLHRYFGRGLVGALTLLGEAATQGARAGTPGAPMGIKPDGHLVEVAGGVGASLVIGGLGFVLYRRRKLAREGSLAFEEAVASGEGAYSELILAADELDTADATDIQLRAADLKQRFDGLVRDAQTNGALKRDSLVVGKLRHFESEFAALRSTSLQKGRRLHHVEVTNRSGSTERRDDALDGADRVDTSPVRGADRPT